MRGMIEWGLCLVIHMQQAVNISFLFLVEVKMEGDSGVGRDKEEGRRDRE